MRFLGILLFTLFLVTDLFAQVVTHGPIVGAVTPYSARMTIRTQYPTTIQVWLDTSSAFSAPRVFSLTTTAAKSNLETLDIDGLNPETRYHFQTIFAGQPDGLPGSFKSWPLPGKAGTYRFHFGSCMNDNLNDDHVFQEMLNHPADFFLQIGDWGYPDVTDNLPNNNDFFSADYNRVIQSYIDKYSYNHMRNYLRHTPIDYVYDDHDYVNDNTSRNTASYTSFFPTVSLQEIPFPPGTRRNAIKGYYELFPAYEPVDSTEGLFHTFRYGNVEVFMLDNRSARTPNMNSLQHINFFQVQFNPPPGHTILGDAQRTWLFEQLKKSTATWKFIATGTAFNQTYRDALLGLLNLGSTIGLSTGAALVDSWCGYPMDQDSLILVVEQEKIDGVVMMSGDTHTTGIDDGTNAGLPEIMAGCLSQVNTSALTTTMSAFGLKWNKGGQGVGGNLSTDDSFGNVEIFGDDSIRLTLIEEDGDIIATHTIYSCSFLTGLTLHLSQVNNASCFGSTDGSIHLSASGGTPPYRYVLNGEIFSTAPVFNQLGAGVYEVTVRDSLNCSKSLSVTISQPEPIADSAQIFDAFCYGAADGSLSVFLSGGTPPYQLNWSTGETSANLNNLSAGVFSLNVTDSLGCFYTATYEITQPNELLLAVNPDSLACGWSANGQLAAQLNGGTPGYNLLWSNGSTQASLSGLAPGVYQVTATDQNQCTATVSALVYAPDSLLVNAASEPDTAGNGVGKATVFPGGGVPPYQYQWSTGGQTETISGLFTGIYAFTVTDANGCQQTGSVSVGFVQPSGMSDPEAPQFSIYPNPAESLLYISANTGLIPLQVSLFDLSGRKQEVAPGSGPLIILNVAHLPSGVYLVRIETPDQTFNHRVLIR